MATNQRNLQLKICTSWSPALIKLKCSEKSPAWSEENSYLHRENLAFFRGKVLHEYILSDSKVRDIRQVSYLVGSEKEKTDGKHCLGSHLVLLTKNSASSPLKAHDRIIILPTLFRGHMSCYVQWNLSGHNSLPDNNFHSPCAVCHILLFLLAWWWVTFETSTAPSAGTSRDFMDMKALMPHKVTQGEKPIKGPGFGSRMLLYHNLVQPLWQIWFFNIFA